MQKVLMIRTCDVGKTLKVGVDVEVKLSVLTSILMLRKKGLAYLLFIAILKFLHVFDPEN